MYPVGNIIKYIESKLNSTISGFVLFVIIMLPSVKMILIDSYLLNLLPVFITTIYLIINKDILLLNKKLFLGYAVLFLLLFLSYFLNIYYFPSIDEFIKYIVLAYLTLVLPAIINIKSVKFAILLMLVWALMVSFYQFFWKIPTGDTYHYLTVGLPIAILILISFSRIIYHTKLYKKTVYFLFIIWGYTVLFTLFGRSPILFTSLIIILFCIIHLLFESSLKKRLLIFSLFFATIFLFINFVNKLIPGFLLNRFVSLFNNMSDEPRVNHVYLPSFKAIYNKPFFGNGLSSSYELIGIYPHNIFLEILMYSGLFGFFVFLLLSFKYLKEAIYSIRYYKVLDRDYLSLVFLSLFHFLFWNVSNSLSSAYALLPLMALISYKKIR